MARYLILGIIAFVFVGCHNNLKINTFVDNYKGCADSLVTYDTGAEWNGLLDVSSFDYYWGKDSLLTRGKTIHYNKISVGKGSVLLLEKERWVIYQITYTKPMGLTKKGNHKPLPSTYNVKVFLKKMCD